MRDSRGFNDSLGSNVNCCGRRESLHCHAGAIARLRHYLRRRRREDTEQHRIAGYGEHGEQPHGCP